MNAKYIAVFFLLPFLVGSAHAQNDTFTQVGTWGCHVNCCNGLFSCGNVTFPQEFGNTPSSIIVMGCYLTEDTTVPSLCFDTDHVHVSNLSSKGFTPTGVGPGVGFQTSGYWIAVGPKLLRGTATPNYAILTVIYAPPGTNGGHASSSVSYGSGMTAGTTTSASQSFQNSIAVSVTGTIGGPIGGGGSASLSFDYVNTTTDTYEVKKSHASTFTINRPGPGKDGIDHNEDAIYLVLKPSVNISVSSSAAVWTFGDNSNAHIQYVLVGELNGSFPWRPGVQDELTAARITSADYPKILASDPLANGTTALDPDRFVYTKTMFPYEGPQL